LRAMAARHTTDSLTANMPMSTAEDTGDQPAEVGSPPMVSGTANQSAKTYQIFPTGSYLDRFLNWGRWFSYLFWQPLRAGASPKVTATATIIGWIVIGLLAVPTFVAVRRCRWVWLATGLYTGVLALGWSNV